jgi:pyruvate,orthophosphate dikinase
MQARSIVAAALEVAASGEPPELEIMLPLIAYETELAALREVVENAASSAMSESNATIEYHVGTMIELPRACLIAARIAAHADFFSFGTNDLTQTTIGFSRDDVEQGFLTTYLGGAVIDSSPFETVDEPGVGELMQLAVARGRGANPKLGLGVCGEHAGDPQSIRFFERIGLDYVSCSPYRVPIARIASAQAVDAREAG